MAAPWKLRPATPDDAPRLAGLKALAMRPDLERIGRWDPDRARQRFLEQYVPANTDVIELDGEAMGCIAVRPEPDAQWIEHFYLDPALHGTGVGGEVLRQVMAAHRDARPFRLTVIGGSRARRLYERHGFAHAYDDPNGIDEVLEAAGDGGYLLANAQAEAGRRFGALAELFDPGTLLRLAALGVAPGWRCWEVGAGGPSVPAWLAARVGPTGRVLATDIDVSWLPAGAGYEVRQHDVGAEPPPGDGFDLIHARLVLVHVPQRAAALSALVAALRPGGRLLLEEADPALQPLACPDEAGEDERRANRLRHAFRSLMAERGVDLAYGRTLPRVLRAAGLVDVAAESSFPFGGAVSARLERATIEQLRARLTGSGRATDAEVDAHLAALDAGRLDIATAPMVSAWGTRP
ncbi:GNAT family N-acetyltransferase [Dactylosporangium salmoneum]|uniref:N-acetyltransferase domain-containing protein n=1 Tax=Dactylosporangium salmoneum TaxID=53361 RepID=A0ABP5SDK3_9ACTN